jgi:hypothetical protein
LSQKENVSQIDLYVQIMPDPDDYRVWPITTTFSNT